MTMQARKDYSSPVLNRQRVSSKIEIYLTLSSTSPPPFAVSNVPRDPCRGVFERLILKAPFSFGQPGAQGVECQRDHWSSIE